MTNQGIGYGYNVEVQQIIPENSFDPILTSFLIGIIIFLIVLIVLQVRNREKTKLYNPKRIKTIRVKIHE